MTVFTDPDAGAGDSKPTTANAAGSGTPHDTCLVTPALLKAHRSCHSDADCELIAYRPNCCDHQRLTGIAIENAEEVRACVANEGAVCQCSEQPARADDGRVSAGDDVEVHCVENQCKTSITTRRCGGDLLCRADEICVAFENHPTSVSTPKPGGGNALYTYDCMRNPCKGSLNCSCAASLCEARTDAQRVCAVEFSVEADVACSRFKD